MHLQVKNLFNFFKMLLNNNTKFLLNAYAFVKKYGILVMTKVGPMADRESGYVHSLFFVE